MTRLLALAMLASLALLMPGHARAAADCPSNGTCDQGTAFAMCKAAIERTKQKFDVPGNPWGKPNVRKDCTPGGTAASGSFTCAVGEGPNGGAVRCYNAAGDDNTQQFYYNGACSTRPYELGWQGGETAATVNACHNGCMYTSSLDPEGAAGVGFFPTGGTCTESDAPAPTPAGDGGDPGGGDGGGTDPGGGDGGGDNGGGDGDGGGPGPGPGPGEGDGDGPGEVGGDGGPLYERDKNLTLDKVFNDFKQQVEKLPIIQATKSFFTVSVGGSCPVFTLPASQYWDTMTFDLHCYGVIYESFLLMGWVLLAIAAFMAAKIALT